MGPKDRRVREKEQLRQEILDAARELFVKEGFANVSMRKVAEKIEYSPTTIYFYFKDKVDLLHCLCLETFTKLVKTFESLTTDMGDPVECLRKGLRAYIAFGLKYPNHYQVTFIQLPEHPERPGQFLYEKTEAMGQNAFAYLRMIVSECIRQKKFRKVDVETTSQALWSAVHGLTSLLIVHHKFPFVDRDKLIDHLIDTLIEGLRA